MKNQQRLIALLAILVTILAYAAFAATTADTQNQTPPPPPQGPTDGLGGPGGPGMRDAGQRPGGPGFMLPLQALDLTSDQKDAVKAILEANRQASQAARKAVGEATRTLHEAIANDANDLAIRNAAAAMATAAADQGILQVKVSTAIKALLTKDQLQKLADIRAQIKDRPAGPMDGQMDGPRGGFGRPDGPQFGPEPEPLD